MIYTGNNPMILQSIIHSEKDTGMLATGYNSQITGLLNSGDNSDINLWENHLGREYFRKLSAEGLGDYITDEFDVGFRPVSITGVYVDIIKRSARARF
jgi:hypothetical protein